jgi:hypothetical protein
MKALALFIGTLGLLAIAIAWNGYVLSVLWAWFIVTAFAAPKLSVAAACGVSLVYGHLKLKTPSVKDNRGADEKLIDAVVYGFLAPAFTLVFGWIIKGLL